MNDTEDLYSPLFVAMTRPLTLFGVTLEFVTIIGIIIFSLCILSDSLMWVILYLPFHIIAWFGCQYDPFFFTIFNQWLSLRYNPNYNIWGCRAYEPS